MTEGTNTVQGTIDVDDIEGRVVLTIRQPNKDPVYTAHDPGQAMELADVIAKASYHAKYGKRRPLEINLSDMVLERKRTVLVKRLNLIVRQLLADGKSNDYIVNTLIDHVMAEIT